MGTADINHFSLKLSYIDLVVASVRNTHGTEWRIDQLKSLLDHVGRLVTDMTASYSDIENLDVLGDLVDQAAIQCEFCVERNPSRQDQRMEAGQRKFDELRGVQ